MARRRLNVFSLSFLDAMTCGFGAVVLFYMIINASYGRESQQVIERVGNQRLRQRLQLQFIITNQRLVGGQVVADGTEQGLASLEIGCIEFRNVLIRGSKKITNSCFDFDLGPFKVRPGTGFDPAQFEEWRSGLALAFLGPGARHEHVSKQQREQKYLQGNLHALGL